MGRGRQKAKATKQAREMKYYSPETNYDALQRELSSRKPEKNPTEVSVSDDYYSDLAAKYADMYDETDDGRTGLANN